ncbi:MAG: aminomethyl-transferring glycine dehydrogenase subunit GcvPA, partial [Acidaminobacteraceae bacterium]
MAIASSKKAEKILISEGLNPEAREVLKTYAHAKDIELDYVALKNGATDMEEMASKMSGEIAGVIVQNPNFLGVIEDVEAAVAIAHDHKALLIDYVDPMSLAILKTPGEMGVDIAVGEAQTFGNTMNLGGPYIGFLATTKKLIRKIPGRIAGETVDADGKRSFVLTLQAREQHIRRFKATSNICSNQGLNVLVSAIYMVTMGKAGIKEVAMQSMAKAHYTYESLIATGKFSPAFEGQSFFREFAIKAHKPVSEINANLLENNYLGGYDLSKDYDLDNTVLIALTEKRTKDEIDNFVKLMEV